MRSEKLIRLDSTEVDCFLRCPLRYHLTDQGKRDPAVAIAKTWDRYIAWLAKRMLLNPKEEEPSTEELLQFTGILMSYDKSPELSQYVLQHKDRILKTKERLYTFTKNGWSLLPQPHELKYASYGCEVTITVPFTAQRITRSSKDQIPVGPTSVFLVEVDSITPYSHGTKRFWATVVKHILEEQLLNSVPVYLLRLQELKVLPIPNTNKESVSVTLKQILEGIRTPSLYPRYGFSCKTCPVQLQCLRFFADS